MDTFQGPQGIVPGVSMHHGKYTRFVFLPPQPVYLAL